MRRVAIVGGGISGLTTAFELSRTEALRRRFDVTVYQQGWRLGGKLASGRNPAHHWRNEEHGLHVWFGFYDNTFDLADEVLKRWRKPEGCPFQCLDDIIEPHDLATMAFRGRDRAHQFHRLHLPRRQNHHCDDEHSPLVLQCFDFLAGVLRAFPNNVLESMGRRRHLSPRQGVSVPPPHLKRLTVELERVTASLARLSSAELEQRHAIATATGLLVRAIQQSLAVLFALARRQGRAPQYLHTLDILMAIIRGILSDEHQVYLDGDLDRLQDWELGDWLAHHGARQATIEEAAILRGQYDALFQFRRGSRQHPHFEAGTAVRIILRGMAPRRGAVSWLLQAGMGEALIAPIYEVLRAQGVRFEFFHRAEAIELDDSKSRVERLTFARQARLKTESYEPLVTFKNQRVWLSEPDWSQLETGEALREQGADFESLWSPPYPEDSVCLHRSADFDEVVLALPLGALVGHPDCGQGLCREWFEACPEVRSAAEAMNLQPSIAAQIWLERPICVAGSPERAAIVGWGDDLSIFCDMSPVIEHEGWGAKPPKSSVYFCGVLDLDEARAPREDLDAPARARDKVERLMGARLEHEGYQLFGSEPSPWDWRDLRASSECEGDERVGCQYLRANINPTDLCDGAAPGTARLRLEAHESGLDNMALASTWTRTGINSTCVEAAVSSGMAAARALGALDRPIKGEAFFARPFAKSLLPSIEGALEPDRRMQSTDRAALSGLLGPGGELPTELEIHRADVGQSWSAPWANFLLLSGEIELWDGERLLGIRRGPWSRPPQEREQGRLRYVATEMCRWTSIASDALTRQSQEAVYRRYVRELEETRRQAVSSHDEFFDSENAGLIPGPYEFGPFSALMLLMQAPRGELASLLPKGLHTIPGRGDRYLLLLASIENARCSSEGAPENAWSYQELTPLIPCLSRRSRPGVFVPELYPDTVMPILLGRETYGFPKRIARIEQSAGAADVVVEHRRILKLRYEPQCEIGSEELFETLLGELAPMPLPLKDDHYRVLASRIESFPLPVYVRRRFLSSSARARGRWRSDELVQVPFRFGAIQGIQRLNGHAELADDHAVLRGRAIGMWKLSTSFRFAESKVIRDYRPLRARLSRRDAR